MISNYGKIIKQLEDQIFSFIDEFEDEKFIFDGNFMRFRFITDDNIVYNKGINIPVCIISLSSVIGKEHIYRPVLKLQNVFMKMKVFKKYKLFFMYKYKRWITLLIIKNRDVILKRAKDYYYNKIETIRKNMRYKYKDLSKEERGKIKKYQKNYREKMKNNLSEEKKEKSKEYQTNYREKKKTK